MNRDIIEGRWKQFKGKLKAQFERLSDDNLDAIIGKRLGAVGKGQEGRNITKDGTGKQVERFAHHNTG